MTNSRHNSFLTTIRIVLGLAIVAIAIPTKILAAPSIGTITTNSSSYTNSQVPKYSKFEISFPISNTTATNFFFPYDSNPPAGLTAGTGITVNALFLAPGETDWNKAYTTPAFYYQDFDYQVKNNQDWIWANGNFAWKVRFAPNKVGTWQYKVTAIDSSGNSTSGVQSFVVTDSTSHGFVKVSPTDSRYFQFDDGTFFPGLGINMNYSTISWTNPVTSNQSLFTSLQQKGVQLIRMWQSQWAIFGSFWNPWHYNGNLIDYTWLTGTDHYSDSDFSLTVSTGLTGTMNPCVSYGGWNTYTPAVKPNTTYRIRARVKTTQMGSAKTSGSPYGLVFKTGQWLDNCGNAGVGAVKGTYLSTNSDWTIITGSYTTGSSENFFPWLYIALDNITTGKAYIDYVWLEQDLGNGQYGTNLISKPWMNHYQYVDQRNSYAFDKMLELAEQKGIYLKVLVLEKNDVIANLTNFDGTVGTNEQNNGNFYGNYGAPTKIYWLQQAWWRYQQARWGYSTSIQSWELLNEGDPGNGNHWKLTDEMAKFMHCRAFGVTISAADSQKCTYDHPNKHLVSTSFWSTYQPGFWGNAKWPNVDYADVHAYISTTFADNATKDLMKYDAALYHKWHSEQLSPVTTGRSMPIMRGEAGLDGNTTQSDTILGLNQDTNKVWMHNYIWSELYSGGLYEEYWWWQEHMTVSGVFDAKSDYLHYAAFLKDIPLNNGKYVDAAATVGNTQLRAWGQKDTTNNRAHLWIQNSKHTWKNVVDGVSISPISTTITLSGFTPNANLKVEWWNTYTGTVTSTTTTTANSQGQISLSVSSISTDTAVKIGDYTNTTPTPTPSPSAVPSPSPKPGDANGDGNVNGVDYVVWFNHYNQTISGGYTVGDFDNSGKVNGVDYSIWFGNYGK